MVSHRPTSARHTETDTRPWILDRVSVALGLTIVLLAGFLVFGIRSTTQVGEEAERLGDEEIALLDRVWQLRLLELQKVATLDHFVHESGPQGSVDRANFNAATGDFDAVLASVTSASRLSGDEMIVDLQEKVDQLKFIEQRLLTLTIDGRTSQAGELSDTDYRAARVELTASLERLFAAVEARVEDQNDIVIDGTRQARVIVILLLSAIASILLYLLYLNRIQRRAARRRDKEKDEYVASEVLKSRIRTGFEMSTNESETLTTYEAVLTQELPAWRNELLLADSSTAHLHRAASTHGHDGPRCPVSTPGECPVIRRGSTASFEGAHDYDSCPHLRGRDLDGGTAVCVPVKVMGKPIGIAHSIAPTPPSDVDLGTLEEVAQIAGDRLGVLRAFATTTRRAERDPLTGLLNRRAIEERVQQLDSMGRRYSVVFADLDHFKQINDVHGHAAGDRGLRLFSQTILSSCRSNDLIARWGGEEFVIVMADTTTVSAVEILDRAREALDVALMNGACPRFTFSAGVTDCEADFVSALARADAALLEAKDRGRNRVIIAPTRENESNTEADPGAAPLGTLVSTQPEEQPVVA